MRSSLITPLSCAYRHISTQTSARRRRIARKHMGARTQKAHVKRDALGLIIPRSFRPPSSLILPVAFNLASVLSHSQCRPQSASTLQHCRCVSHLSLSLLLTLFLPPSDTQRSRKQSSGPAFNSGRKKPGMLSQTLLIPSLSTLALIFYLLLLCYIYIYRRGDMNLAHEMGVVA